MDKYEKQMWLLTQPDPFFSALNFFWRQYEFERKTAYVIPFAEKKKRGQDVQSVLPKISLSSVRDMCCSYYVEIDFFTLKVQV